MEKKKKKILLVLDADYFVFSSLQAAEEETHFGDDVWTLTCDHGKAKDSITERVAYFKEEVTKQFKNGACVVDAAFVFSDPDSSKNWRLKLLPTYKFNRKKEGIRKPVGYTAFVDDVKSSPESFGGEVTYVGDGCEADDLCATLATSAKEVGYDIVMPVSVDKDFYTIPNSYFYHLKVDGSPSKIHYVSQEEADYWHLYQGMKGDITDGFSGIKGVGEKVGDMCIHKWLREPFLYQSYEHTFKSGARKGMTELRWKTVSPTESGATLWDCIVSVGARAGMAEEEVLIGFQMARLTRAGEPEVWTPDVSPWVMS